MTQKVDVLLGLQWGDEGKGKIIDVLTPNYDIVARFQGGPNAGHTLEFNNIKVVLHQVPSGIFHPSIANVIGNGVVLDPVKFKNEILMLEKYIPIQELKKRIIISNEAHLILPIHIWLDKFNEEKKGVSKIGSTLCGIGPCYTDKASRSGIRVGEIFESNFEIKFEKLIVNHKIGIDHENQLFFRTIERFKDEIEEFHESIKFLKMFSILDTPTFLNNARKNGKKILAEGAQGTSLDINFGDYPFVTSSTTVSAGVCSGLGVPPQAIGEVFGLVKAYSTRVGSGPFPTEQENQIGEKLRQKGGEFGATTGRARRCGWLDLPQINRAIMLNGVTQLIISKVDVLTKFGEINVLIKYDNNKDLVYKKFPSWECIIKDNTFSEELFKYLNFIQIKTNVPISYISTGPNRSDIINMETFGWLFKKPVCNSGRFFL